MFTKEDVEQLKRDLYSYGFYTKKIDEVQLKLYELSLKLKDCGSISGISYDVAGVRSDPYHPAPASLIYEEESMCIEFKSLTSKRDSLNIEEKLACLSNEQRELIESHFFANLSQDFIAVNKSYNCREIVTYKIKKSLIKMIKFTRG